MDNLPKNTNLIPPNPQIEIDSLRPFTQFCLSIGAIPSSYKTALTYEEQLLWLCDFLENTVIPTVNQNGLAVTELQELYVELKNYVDNYFTNLDVQEEINNKLDQMATDGTFNTILSSFLNFNLSVPHLSDSFEGGAFNLFKFPGNFNILYDCGSTGQENAIENFLAEKNVTKLNVVILSHFHFDHAGCFEFIARNYCDENTLFFRQMPCNYDRLTNGETSAKNLDELYNLTLRELGYYDNSRTPNQNEIVSLNNGQVKLRFLNCDNEFAEDYYSANSDTDSNHFMNSTLNNFSLMCEITSFNKKVLMTGDIEQKGQINNAEFINKCDLMQIPHHNWNHSGYFEFFNKAYPEICFFNRNNLLTDTRVYFAKYQRQSRGYVPTYYTYNQNVDFNIGNFGISINSGYQDTTFNINYQTNDIGNFLPTYNDLEHNYWNYANWSIANVITMIKKLNNPISVTVFAGSRYTKFLEEINNMTEQNTNFLLNSLPRGFQLERAFNWDGYKYCFLENFNYDNTATYPQNYYKTRFDFNFNISMDVDLTLGNSVNLPNEIRRPHKIKVGMQTLVENPYTYYIILELKPNSVNTYYTCNNEISSFEGGRFLRMLECEISIVNNVATLNKCTNYVYNLSTNNLAESNCKIVSIEPYC